ncbi:MAG: hypothetical protein WBF33_23390 [Candidatus Nitrosopolaris sp.]
MRSINVKVLMGHSIGVENSYYRPQERDISEDYKKAIPSLTISEKAIQAQSSLIEDLRLDKENSIQKMKEKYDADIASLKDEMSFMRELLNSTISR